jgi:hypothetical protein
MVFATVFFRAALAFDAFFLEVRFLAVAFLDAGFTARLTTETRTGGFAGRVFGFFAIVKTPAAGCYSTASLVA